MNKLMPSLMTIKDEITRTKPLANYWILMNMHLSTETVTLGEVLNSGGAQVVYLPSNRNPSERTVIQLANDHEGIIVNDLAQLEDFSIALNISDQVFLVVEGNGKIFNALHKVYPELTFCKLVKGISEHTSGGGHLVDSFDPTQLRVPVVAVYGNQLKTSLETELGTSQTVAAALLRGLSKPIAGRNVVVVGFGNVGRGVAGILRILGARVTVVEKSKVSYLQARLKGFTIANLPDILPYTDICITTTGSKSIVRAFELERAKEGIVLANVSNQPLEIDLQDCKYAENIDKNLALWTTPKGKYFYVLGDGLQVNHVIEKGNPAELMDISFSLHALSLCWLANEDLVPGVYPVPTEFMERVADLVLGGLK